MTGETPLMPAEWERHDATWIAWPKNEEDWPGKFEPIKWVYAEIVRHLADTERVEIICPSTELEKEARHCLKQHGVRDNVRLHLLSLDRSWLRDSAPTAVRQGGKLEWVSWEFNAWAKYDDYKLDAKVPALVSKVSGIPLNEAKRKDGSRFVLEGGAIETDGEGTLLVTEECLLSDEQVRNPGMTRIDYEERFRGYLGIEKVIWLKRGILGDDTHGHIDDVARFVAPGVVLLAYEEDKANPNHETSVENLEILSSEVDAKGGKLRVVKLPMPKPAVFAEQLLPASYANFYIANECVLVPTFNDPADRLALNILADSFPKRRVVGINSVDLVLGLGTLHCLSQQQPA